MRRPLGARGSSRCRHRGARGMTLIEIMMVIGIFVLMMSMVVVGVRTSRAAETIRAVNQVANTVRYGYDKARVGGSYYRLLIDLDKGAFTLQQTDGRMYLPATDRDGKVAEPDPDKAEEQADRDRRAAESYNRSIAAEIFGGGVPDEGGSGDGGGVAEVGGAGSLNPYGAQPREVPRRKPPLFESFEDENALSGLTKPIELPDTVKIVSVRTADDFTPITEGQASIYFFPRGRTQKAHILLEDQNGEGRWTIKVSPLTGRVTIEDGHEALVLPDDPNDEEDDLGERRDRRTF